MPQGYVKFYRESNGYGFIVPVEAGARDVFVHCSALVGGFSALAANQRVEYEVGIDPRTQREKAIRCVPVEPIISPRRVTAFRPDDGPERDEMKAFAHTAFLKS